jgi:hypothetical protein
MNRTFDTYCANVDDLEAARAQVERAVALQFVLHDSMYWGGDYYLADSDEFGEISIRHNYNTYTHSLNEPDHPNCRIIVSVSKAAQPDVLKSRLTQNGLRLLRRAVIEDGKSQITDFVKYLIPVGFYRELRGGEPHQPSLRQAIRSTAMPNVVGVIKYLKAGKVLIATGGPVSDVLDPKAGLIGPPHVVTDKTYAWPAILAYYVERHNVHLPQAFVAHMAKSNWSIPSGIDVQGLDIDWRLWTDSAENRPGDE